MLGTLLGGRYRIITILGAGGFGQTYLAEDTQQSRNCVVKQFKPASRDTQFLQVARRLFDTEARILRRLGQHDQIPELYDSFEEAEEFYLVQEFVDGHSLSDELSRGKQLEEDDIIGILRDVLGVLKFVHQNQVIHRDIKPGNLIRRKHDGKIVLIDFGAVKEINTQLTGTGQTGFTVGIGTQGYTPSEQLMGKPRYCSDIYALGMTVIQAGTGLPPSQLPEDPGSLEIYWRDRAHLGPGLTFIIDRMVRYDCHQRYQHVDDVLNALDKLADLPTNITEMSASMLPSLLLPESLLRQREPLPETNWRSHLKAGVRVVAIATTAVTALMLGIRQLGWMEAPELGTYDQLTRLQTAPSTDPRMLIVGISEADLRNLKRTTPSDESVAQVLQQLQKFQPRVIGLDLYRDVPQEPGNAELLNQLKAKNVIAVMQLSNSSDTQIAPPPGIPEEQVGFTDLTVDPDSVIRRNLMFAFVNEKPYHSFSLRLALQYLAKQGIVPDGDPSNPQFIRLGNTVLRPLEATSGAYQHADAAGYQILLKYRSPDTPAPILSFTDVMNGKLDPKLVQDKIVLIGTIAPSSKDLYTTPYSSGKQTDLRMPGVVVHAQMTSQLLSTVLDGEPLPWFIPDWAEILCIVGWAIVGGSLAWMLRHPVALAGSTAIALIVLTGTGVWVFSQQGWIPVVAPAIALIITDLGVATYRIYRDQKENRAMTQLLWQQTVPFDLTRKH